MRQGFDFNFYYRRISLVSLLFFSSLFHGGCTTPRGNVFSGLLDRWSKAESGARHPSYRLGKKRGQDGGEISAEENESIKTTVSQWQWPLKNVSITSEFGNRDGRPHEGIDFRASTGTPVHAVADGTVVYSHQKISGYGRMVVIRHEGNLFSVYAHHSKNMVRVGQKVKMGQKIGLSGRSGRVTGPHLHFELRWGSQAVDPLQYFTLPQEKDKLARIY